MKKTDAEFMHRFGEMPELVLGKDDIYSHRWQIIVLLLAAAYEKRGISRREVIDQIRTKKWFNFIQEDSTPYPGTPGYTPRWETNLGWAYQDCKRNELIPCESNDWHPTIKGENFFKNVKGRACEQVLKLDRCDLWSADFKALLNPAYQPSPEAKTRQPLVAYRDSRKKIIKKIEKKIGKQP